MALGNVLGYATGSYGGWYSIFPFTVTKYCGIDCANLKSAFLLDVVFLTVTTYISISSAPEIPLTPRGDGTIESLNEDQQEAFVWELVGSIRYLPISIWIIFTVTALTWIGWFPFVLFDTDWMGREIYKGDPDGGEIYHSGVRMGSFGLMLNSVILGVTSMTVEKLCRKWGAGLVLGISNIIMFVSFLAMIIIAIVANNMDYGPSGFPPKSIIIAALLVFTVLGAPLAVCSFSLLHVFNKIFNCDHILLYIPISCR